MDADVCISGGGPAGVMLGLLLARQGVEVVVVEKHADFFRDFRGDTVHPSTLNLIDALGLRSRFDAIPHDPLPRLDAVINGIRLHAIDLSSLPRPNDFLTLMPQWDLLALLAEAGAEHPSFRLRMGVEAAGVLHERGRVAGIRTTDGEDMRAALTVAADGRDSTVRRALGLTPRSYGVPIDVLWFRLPRPTEPLPDTLLWANENGLLVTIPRPGYLQCGLLIPKSGFARVQADGLEAFRRRITTITPRLAGPVTELASLDDVKLLSVQVDRLEHWWRPGALCIGDAAHAMSPVFGVGINYAIQDAVAAAQRVGPALRDRFARDHAVDRACAAVQRRRELPTAAMQRLQRGVHGAIATGALARVVDNPPTRGQRAALRSILPALLPLAARMIGYGFRPERIR
ncbi:FAD-dependent oxidoreductase [Microbacterium candidum]|uniref:FAD-dependent oxidoreductase n=1 Tax=Microbacterium candidum TaxID=3041922 RepID=A0ABT7MUU9_9MICO|nr:FAD-dependent oxidoreductase [Microbacterium sp. ASV49]MDL9978231.1 FAD-dependent oxidoreductase [Microbacterium sp. ASV49]